MSERPMKLQLALANYNHIEGQAALAMTKMSLLIATQAVLLGVYAQTTANYAVFSSGTATRALLGMCIYALGGISLLTGLLTALTRITPRSKPIEGDLLFYASIAAPRTGDGDQYARSFNAATEDTLLHQLLANTHGKAVWLRGHFDGIRIAIAFTFIGIATAALGVMLLATLLYRHG